jgi:hypothetical protein
MHAVSVVPGSQFVANASKIIRMIDGKNVLNFFYFNICKNFDLWRMTASEDFRLSA